MNNRDGVAGCRCVRPLIRVNGVCSVCGLERLHIDAKVPSVPFSSAVLPHREGEAA